MPRFEMLIGPMSSSKTTSLINKAFQFKSIGKTVLCISPDIDTRSKSFISKNNASLSLECLKVRTLMETIETCFSHDTICIDELQFFGDALPFLCVLQARNYNGTVLMSALLGDSNMRRWPTMDEVLPMMDEVTFMKAYCAICSNGTLAPFTRCLILKESTVLIGGTAEYISVCRHHFYNN